MSRGRASRRDLGPRKETVTITSLTRESLRKDADLVVEMADDLARRPRTRGDCIDGMRPCPWVGCAFNLYLDVSPTGSITLNYPNRSPLQLATSCALDVAARGGITLEEVGELLNLTRERIRQVEVRALLKLRQAAPEGLT